MLRLLIITFFLFTSCLAQAQLQPLTVMLDWELNPDHAPLIVADEYGFFTKQGLSVKLIPPSDPSDPPKFAAVGKVDLAISYEPEWILQQKQGLPLIWASTLVGQPLNVIITNPQITQPSQLRGQNIGYSGAADEIFLHTVLQSANLTMQDVNLINVHYDLIQSLMAKRVMVIAGAMRNVEPLELQQKNFAYNLFYPEKYGVPSYAELILLTRPALQNDSRIKAFNVALAQATAYLKQHPEETWQTFAKANPALSDESTHKMWLASVKYFYDTPGKFDQVQYEKMKKYLAAYP